MPLKKKKEKRKQQSNIHNKFVYFTFYEKRNYINYQRSNNQKLPNSSELTNFFITFFNDKNKT